MQMDFFRLKWQAFKAWQQMPPQVAPNNEEQQVCATCETHFIGNYCPRCGQRANVKRYSAKTAMLNFFDVWGMGNRSMFRTIRDLALRPGYMIRDFLSGRQMVYFPPFKMLFIFITLSFFVSHLRHSDQMFEKGLTDGTENLDVEFANSIKQVFVTINNHPSETSLVTLLVLTPLFYRLFRKSPAIDKLRFSEMFITLVYMTVLLNIISVVADGFILLVDIFGTDISSCVNSISGILIVILAYAASRQLFGFSPWQTIWRMILAAALFLMLVLFLTFVLGTVVAIQTGKVPIQQ